MNRYVGLIAAGVAAAALVAWLVLHERDRPAAPAPETRRGPVMAPRVPQTAAPLEVPRAEPSPPTAGMPDVAPDGQPTPPAPESVEPASLEDAFLAEPRDAAWADEHERELRRRLAGRRKASGTAARAKIEATECRRRQCRITASAPDDGALGELLAALQEEGVLEGYADQMVIDGVDDTKDGRRVRIYAQFERE